MQASPSRATASAPPGRRAVAASFAVAGVAASVACASEPARPQRATEPPALARPTSAHRASTAAAEASASASAAVVDAGASPAAGAAITAPEAEALLFGSIDAARERRCPVVAAGEDAKRRARCLVSLAYEADLRAQKAALELWDGFGGVAGLDRAWTMDGGYRGMIEIVPERPTGADAKHLEWVVGGAREADAFFTRLRAKAGEGKVRYRHRDLRFKFFRSKGKRTPSAYAEDWAIAYNVAGSLHRDQASVTETLFHETFHLNDADHAQWSQSALGELHARIVKTCGEKTSCLAPYAPNATMVRGGTFYAFHGGNGPHEYAAELAVRYFAEQRAVWSGKPLAKPAFKCGPSENAAAYAALAREFFGGYDGVPACPAAPG